MCGVIGIIYGKQTNNNVANDLVETLFQLQHRGQDGCGIVTNAGPGTKHFCHKGSGLVSDVFIDQLCPDIGKGSLGIGHVRYRTSGSQNVDQVQPLSSIGQHVMDLAHNGHVSYPTPTHPSGVDSYAILETLSLSLDAPETAELSVTSIVRALQEVYLTCRGSFSCTLLLDGHILVGFRDPYGIKPLSLGKRQSGMGSPDWMIASESVAFKQLDFLYQRDVQPGKYTGEVVVFDGAMPELGMKSHLIVPAAAHYPDIFEYVYFARSDSVMDGISVHKCRQRMGMALAQTCLRRLRKQAEEIDVVIPVPETSYVSAVELAKGLGKPLSLGLVKNRYSNRSFILPNQGQRIKAVQRKLSAVEDEIRGKNVLIVDDSIVRGSTSSEIVAMARRAGAAKVVFASASPAIRYNHIYGIDLADPQTLVAHGRSDEEVAVAIGADAVIYLPLRDLVECCLEGRQDLNVQRFEVGMFTGEYVDRAHEVSTRSVSEWAVPETNLRDESSGEMTKSSRSVVKVR